MEELFTFVFSDGKKITADPNKVHFYNPCDRQNNSFAYDRYNINTSLVIYARPADETEIKHFDVHGW